MISSKPGRARGIVRNALLSLVGAAWILAGSDAAQAAGKVTVGTCNLALVLAFHPLMQTYVPAENKFFRPLPGEETLARRVEKSRARIDLARKVVYDLFAEKATVAKEGDALRAEFAKSKRRVDASIEDEKKNPSFKSLDPKFMEEAKRLEDDFFKKEGEIRKKDQDVDLRIGKASEDLYAVNYLTYDEQQKLVAQIQADVDRAIDVAAEKYKVEVVLNNVYTFTIPPAKRSVDPHALPNPENVTIPTSIYAEEISKILPKEMDLGSFHAKNVTDGLAFRYLAWYDKRADVLAPFQNGPVNDFVLRGGVDLTPDVLETVLKTHAIDPQTVSFLSALVKKRFSLQGALDFKR